jgi:hypothetical protein
MLLIERNPEGAELQPLKLGAEKRNELAAWTSVELDMAQSARHTQEEQWRTSLRQYSGRPAQKQRNTPIEHAPNIEVSLGAIVADSIYAQAIDLAFAHTQSRILTVRTTGGARSTDDAQAMQRLVDVLSRKPFLNLRAAGEHSILDTVQLGTGIYYIPWYEARVKTDMNTLHWAGPRLVPVPPEDIFVPGGAYEDIQLMRWLGYRTWPTLKELHFRAKMRGWDLMGVQTASNVDQVRQAREQLGKTQSDVEHSGQRIELFDMYAHYDIDNDGIEESILYFYDRSSQRVIAAGWTPFERRPFVDMRYQIRSHLFYGIGVVEMLQQYQEAVTETLNYWLLNMFLANCRAWKAPPGLIPDGTALMWPNKVFELGDPDALQELKLSDAYNSGPMALQILSSLAERRTGAPESQPRPSQILQSRTPATTALSAFQAVNRRFTPAFTQIAMGTANAFKQALFRYSERIRMEDPTVRNYFERLLGREDAARVISVMRSRDFDDEVEIELTAASPSISQDADKQNQLLLVNILTQYYQGVMQMAVIANNPQLPPQVKDVAMQIAERASEVIDRTLRTFENIRDPEAFIVKLQGDLDRGMDRLNPEGLRGVDQLAGILNAGAGQLVGPAQNGTGLEQ